MAITLDDAKKAVEDSYLLPFALKLLTALVILVVGRWLARALIRGADNVMERSKMDVSSRKFLGNVLYGVLSAVLIVAALDTVGVKITAILAVLGAAGLAIGLAVQGTLSNIAAGVILIVLRPYKIGDWVMIGKYLGRVDAIKVFHTIIITPDNREITIPNATIIAAPIENYTVLGQRRIDLVVSIAQASEVARVRELLTTAVANDERVQKQPAPTVEVAEISDATIKLHFRPWTSVDGYSKVVADTMERIKAAMDHSGLKYTVTLQAET